MTDRAQDNLHPPAKAEDIATAAGNIPMVDASGSDAD